jgi:hypothetical protein
MIEGEFWKKRKCRALGNKLVCLLHNPFIGMPETFLPCGELLLCIANSLINVYINPKLQVSCISLLLSVQGNLFITYLG